MTKSETISNLKAYLDGDTAIGNIITLRSILESAIKYLSEPSLPSDLDDAAEKYSENILANNEDLQDAIEDAFKAGAEWMAEQGALSEATIGYYNHQGLSILTESSIKKLGLKEGDKVVVQIRKK